VVVLRNDSHVLRLPEPARRVGHSLEVNFNSPYPDAELLLIMVDSINLGRGRLIPRKPMFHHSVKTRMDNSELRYKPRARYERGTESYVS
jgi:hypothetical protein